MQIQIIPIDQVKPYNKNPRVNAEAVRAVKKSLEEFGFQQPLVIDGKNEVIVGHTRLKAATEIGLKKVPCVVADNLDPKQVKAGKCFNKPAILFNPTGPGLTGSIFGSGINIFSPPEIWVKT